ncbi:ankyrin-3-like isoform X2 [Physella acuta]|nr:ankyrin-3-like isoform X2 [Physella acuta]XP_059141603.1 ankyrin-3-like isoform X2 [Physella acuta]
MGVYSSSFVIEPSSELAVCGFSHPSKANWVTAHAIATELSIAEVERLWLRFQQMGANKDGFLTQETLASSKLNSDVFIKNILKYFKSSDGKISFESFLRALKWSESQELEVKAKAIFQMLNSGNPIPRDIFQKILSKVYSTESEYEIYRITDILYNSLDSSKKGLIDEKDFVKAVLGLPRPKAQNILSFHILSDHMRDNVHKNLPEFSSQAAFYTPSPQVSQIPSDNILREVAEKIHRKDWELVANRLSFFSEDIEHIKINNPNSSFNQAYRMLLDWKHREGENAKGSVLEKILRNAGMIEASLLLAP